MKVLKNRKTLVATSIALALIVVMSATFAWFTAQAKKENIFKNQGYDISDAVIINEVFDETDPPEIGELKPKEVSIANTGSMPVLVRVTFEEMVKLLKNNGDITLSTSSDLTSGMIRIPVDASLLTTENEWTEITGSITGIPDDVKIFEKNGLYNGYFAASDGVKQKISFGLEKKLDDTYVILASGIQYGFYTEGTAEYNSWNKMHNWSAWSGQYSAGSSTIPAAADINTFVKDTNILLKYNESAFAATPTTNKWFYNEVDGYFYWIGVLGGGEFTPNMLTKVGISSDADQGPWKMYDFRLIVCLEVLQANIEALTDTEATGNAAGWQLKGSDGEGTANNALYNALVAEINAYNA